MTLVIKLEALYLKNHETKFSINQMLKDKIKKKNSIIQKNYKKNIN